MPPEAGRTSGIAAQPPVFGSPHEGGEPSLRLAPRASRRVGVELIALSVVKSAKRLQGLEAALMVLDVVAESLPSLDLSPKPLDLLVAMLNRVPHRLASVFLG
jgi:hypothetical protein